jgi:putative PEP-CTERM system TPR-repeat lipoprotein
MNSTLNKRPLRLLAQALLVTVSLAACEGRENVGALISEAHAYQKKGESKAAIIQLKNALQKNPDNAEARSLLGNIYYETGDVGSAEKEIRKALALGADPADLLPTLGKVLLLERQYQKVLDEVKQPAGAAPDPRYLSLQGHAYLGLGKVREAGKSFDLALKAKPDFADALIGAAKVALAGRDVDAAAQFIERATTTSPDNVDAWLFKGDLLHAQGKTADALAAYDKAAALKPDNISAHIAIAHLQIGAGKFDAAKMALDAARKRDPKSLLVAYTQALLDFKQGKFAAAQESVQQVLQVAPDHMPSVLLAGAIQYGLGSTQQAEQYLKKYVENDPGNAYASRLLVATLLKNGETTRAIKTLTPLLKDGDKDVQLLSLAGEAYMKAKDYAKATEYFEKASALAPDTASIRTALGLSSLAKGDNARGIAELEMATNLDPQVTQSGILLVMTHVRLKEFDKALAIVAKLEKSQPDNPLLQNLKGGIYVAMNNASAARSSFQKALAMQPTYFPAIASLAQLDMRDRKPEAAQKRLESFLQADPKNVQAMTALAGIAFSQGRKAEATAWLERASKVKPDDPKPAMLLAAHYLRIGDVQKAHVLAQKLQTANPDTPEVLDLLAQTQLANNDRAAALQSYKKLIDVAPNSAQARMRIAGVYAMQGDQEAAADALKTASSLDPDYLDAKVALATLEVRRGNPEQALIIARELEAQPRNKAAGYVLEGDILMSQKKPELARKAYEQAMALNKNGLIAIKLHDALARAGKEKEGEAGLVQWLKEHPQDVATRMYLATGYVTSQQNRQAIEQYQTVLQTEPNNAGALNNLALVYQKDKDPRALQFAEKAYANAPESAAVLDTLGWLLIEQGNTARGLPLLQKSASLAPDEADIHYHFAQALLKSGEKAKARAELERLLASSKSFSRADEAQKLLRQLQ